ncbi:MAG: hypothetical protein IJS13_03125 [Paludibacteraceae bacterium]|nr:hypothetical protein [Paludibacteraceae bacterium]
MEEKKELAFRYIVYIYVLFTLLLCTSCKKCLPDDDMTGLAETYIIEFHNLNLSKIQHREQYNYYICEFNDSSSFIVSSDCKLIRNVRNNMEVVSTNASEDTTLPNSLKKLITIVNSMYNEGIKYINVQGTNIRMVKFNGCYFTNVNK